MVAGPHTNNQEMINTTKDSVRYQLLYYYYFLCINCPLLVLSWLAHTHVFGSDMDASSQHHPTFNVQRVRAILFIVLFSTKMMNAQQKQYFVTDFCCCFACVAKYAFALHWAPLLGYFSVCSHCYPLSLCTSKRNGKNCLLAKRRTDSDKTQQTRYYRQMEKKKLLTQSKWENLRQRRRKHKKMKEK